MVHPVSDKHVLSKQFCFFHPPPCSAPKPPVLNSQSCLLPDQDGFMSITLNWDPPTMPPGYSCCPYYFIIFDSLPSTGQRTVRVEGTSLSLYPLNSSRTFFFSVSMQQNCNHTLNSTFNVSLSSSLLCHVLSVRMMERRAVAQSLTMWQFHHQNVSHLLSFECVVT